MPNIFKDGGGAGIGSYVVVFENGQLAENTDFLKLRGAYEAGESIFFSIVDEETKDAMVPASGWIDEESKMHLIARDFDDDKTYVVVVEDAPIASEIHVEAEVKEGIELGEGEIPSKEDVERIVAENGVEIEGSSLVIPEQPGPEPVITIDGVDYYHKQEFDLEEIMNQMVSEGQTYRYFDLLTGEIVGMIRCALHITNRFMGQYKLWALDLFGNEIQFVLKSESEQSPSNYTSRAFIVVDTQEEVTDNTKICLPTCSAYYGFLSEDGNTFISYYNLKSDGPSVPEYVDSIKQGNAVVPLKDMRVPEVVAEDYDKYLHVNAETGALEYAEAQGGGSVEIEGSSLVIPEQEAPQPVATIDGVAYYHKREINLEEALAYDDPRHNSRLNVFTGEWESSEDTNLLFYIGWGNKGYWYLRLICEKVKYSHAWDKTLYDEYSTIDYTSTAFNLVDSTDELVKFPDAYLPKCSAYYGFLSEDGKTFISYYNLKTDAAVPEYIDSIKQGNDVIPMKDDRLPAAEQADAGKVLKVAAAGGWEIADIEEDDSIKIPDTIDSHSTIQDIANLGVGIELPGSNSSKDYDVNFEGSIIAGSFYGHGKAKLRISNYGRVMVSIPFEAKQTDVGQEQIILSFNASDATDVEFYQYTITEEISKRYVPNLPGDVDSKTYALETSGNSVVWAEKQSGGGTDVVDIGDGNSLWYNKTLKNLLDIAGEGLHLAIFHEYLNTYGGLIDIRSESGNQITVGVITTRGDMYIGTGTYGVAVSTFKKFDVPYVPSDASNKTYVFKMVNGLMQWVEEPAQ